MPPTTTVGVRSAIAGLSLAAIVAGPSLASGLLGDFRVLPYQQAPALDGILITWFTIEDLAGEIVVEGPGLEAPLVVASVPELDPTLDYQAQAELDAGGEFPFATTAIFDGNGEPARNWRHEIRLEGLLADREYAFTVNQGDSTYANTFRTAPEADTDRTIRLAVYSDSETLVRGRTRYRDWSRTTPQTADSTGRPEGDGRGRNLYMLSETLGFQENIRQIKLRDPDLVVMPGDLVEGTGNEQQRRWDEFWRHNAGSYDDLLSGRPIVAAIGNNCIYNGGGGDGVNANVNYARRQWSSYFTSPANGVEAFQDLYFRTDYGPITILTLCSVGAMGDNDDVAPPVGQYLSGKFPQNLDTNRAWLTGYPFGDIADFNVGTLQYAWAEQQLAEARAEGRIVFVQWHHTPWSRGVHGTSVTSTQSGEAMRIYLPMLEAYGVAAVFCGHSEVSEMSVVDSDGDGFGLHIWDVGAAGDGLRGVNDAEGSVNGNIAAWRENPLNPEGAAWSPNPYDVWTADQNEPETWNGLELVSGGKHYGFLEVDVEPLGGDRFEVVFQYWHNFPLLAGDEAFTVTGFELRPYSNRVVMRGRAESLRPVPVQPECSTLDLDGDGSIGAGDLAIMIGAYGTDGGDVDGDGVTDGRDLTFLLGAFGSSCSGG